MIPRSLVRQLNRLRRRERLLRLSWTAARCLAAFAVVFAAACLIDFVVDLYRDTPRWLRLGLLGGQIALWLVGSVWVSRSIARRLSDTWLSLWIEENLPELGHRLISAVQLNRQDAAIEGMSPEMIAAVTRQAEQQAAAADFARVADSRRLQWSGLLLAPLAIAALVLFLVWPNTVRALFARQFLADRAIPRSLEIESVRAHQIWPAGEEGVLRFRVRGAFAAQLRGEVRLDPKEGGSERHELIFEGQDDSGIATFLARVPPTSHDFTYRAWLKDGRTHEPADVHFEPRPIVRKQQAWVQLPFHVGRKANGQPYEEPQKGADIFYRLPGSSGRITIETQKPIVMATVEVLGPPHALAESTKPGNRSETVRRSVNLVVGEDGRTAEGTFAFQPGIRPDFLATLAAGFGVGGPVCLPWAGLVLASRGDSLQTETAYRIVVRDEFGLENSDKPRRGIRTGPVDPPTVALLPETLAPKDTVDLSEEYEIEGIPILLGQRVPLAYECKAVYGLSHAQLRYRVIPRSDSREDEDEPHGDDFLPLPLGTRREAGKSQREFFARPSADPDKLDGTEGGGRYDFDSAGIPDGKGGRMRLQEGDRIQFYVEVFGRADPDGAPGRSTIREKEVVNQNNFLAWIEKKEDHKERIRQLEEKQRGIAGTVSLLPEDRPRFSTDRPPPREQPSMARPDDGVLGRSWQLLGPFPNIEDAGHARIYPPELDHFDAAKQYDGLTGKIRWQLYSGTTDKTDLQKFFDYSEAGVAYAVCWVKSAGSQRVTLATGSDDGIKVWIDRKLVLDKAVHREAIPGDDKTPVQLRDGWQEVLLKVDNRFGTWAFYFDLLDVHSGKSLPPDRLRVQTRPRTIPGVKAFVENWRIIGPFVEEKGKAHDTAFSPESDPVDLKREYEGRKKQRIRWKEYRAKEGRIDLLQACGVSLYDGRGVVAYAVCWVKCDKEREAILATGSDDGIKVWLDRKIVHDKATARVAQPNSDRTPVRLKAGWNELLVKIDNREGTWAFYLELLDKSSSDKPLPGVQYRTTPPEKKR